MTSIKFIMALILLSVGQISYADNLVVNPGFESGAVTWVQSGNVINNSSSEPPRTGTWKAHLNGYGSVSNESIYQTIAIPANISAASLSFWMHITTLETTTTNIYDTLTVTVRNTSGTVLGTLATYSNLNKNTGYAEKVFDLTAYKGQTVRINFNGIEDSSLKTSFVLDDFSLATTPIDPGGAQTFTSGAVTIRDNTTALPYPVTIPVSGMTGTLSKVVVKFNGLSHTFARDIDVMIVSPTGAKSMLMSDAGSSIAINNATVTFDQTASAAIPQNTAITTGTYRPADYETGDVFAAPAPASPYPADLAAFNGASPNGDWKVYLVDDGAVDIGTIASIALTLTTGTPPSDTTPPTVSMTSPAAGTVTGNVTVSANASDNVGVVGVQFKINGTNLGIEDTTSPYSMTWVTAQHTDGGYTLTASARDAAGNSATSTGVAVTVNNAAPTVNCGTPAPTSSTIIDVTTTGATGNDSTDDTAAIQAAVNQVPAGGTVFVPDGTYWIEAVNAHVNLKSNMTFKMSPGAILKAMPTSSYGYSILLLSNDSNVNIIGGTLDGNREQHIPNECGSSGTPTYCGEYGMGISSYDSSNIYIEEVIAKNGWGDGFYFGGQASVAPPTNINLCKVIGDFNRRQGITITSANGMIVKNSLFKDTIGTGPYSGMDIEPDQGNTVKNVQILNSVFTGNRGTGIKIYNPGTGNRIITNITIDGNTVSKNVSDWGIATLYTTNSSITNNVIQNNWEGINLRTGSTGIIVSNNIVSLNRHGNIIDDGSGNTITNNDTTAAELPIPNPW